MKRVFASLDRHTVCECEFDEPDRYRELLSLTLQQKPVKRVAVRAAHSQFNYSFE